MALMSNETTERLWLFTEALINEKANRKDLDNLSDKVDEININIENIENEVNQSDWNQGDVSSKDYIKNRPFYENVESKTFLDEMKFTGFQTFPDRDAYYYGMELSTPITSDKITVTLDGVVYELSLDIEHSSDSEYLYGNYRLYLMSIGAPTSEYEQYEDTGEPCIVFEPDDIYDNLGIRVSTSGEHTISISSTETEIKTLDTKFLPEALQFGEEKAFEDIIWDGNTDGLESANTGMMIYCYKMPNDYSHLEPTDFIGATFKNPDMAKEITITEDHISDDGLSVVVEDGGYVVFAFIKEGGTANYIGANPGLWLCKNTGGSYTDVVSFPSEIKTIDPKYLPVSFETIDDTLSDTSINPVQNKVVNAAINNLSEEIANQAHTIEVSQVDNGATISVTDKNGTKTVSIQNIGAGSVLAGYEKKKILFMGDSITNGSTSDRHWVKWFNEILSPTLAVNVAVSNARWCDYSDTVYDGNPVFNGTDNNHNNTIGNQVEKIVRGKDSTHPNYVEVPDYAEFDMIIISAGTNDNTPSGDIESSFVSNGAVVETSALNKTIFSSAFRYSVETLRGLYPNATIFICTPIQTADALKEYSKTRTKRDYLISLCERMSVEYIDTFMCGICSIYEVSGTSGKYLNDGLHPNASGAKLIARYNAKEIMNHYVYEVEVNTDAGTDGYTNLVPISTDISGNVYNGTGFKNNAKISTSAPLSDSEATGYVSTGFIPMTNGDILRSYGSAIIADDTTSRILAYDSNKDYLWYIGGGTMYQYLDYVINKTTGDVAFNTNTANIDTSTHPLENVAFIRLCLKGTGDELVVTVNEEIV